jgi:hypothetical protein
MPGYFSKDRGRRWATILLFAGLALVWKLSADDAPREQEVRLVLGEAQRSASSVRLSYVMEGEEITGLLEHYPQGAPAQVVHAPQLAPGRYDLSIDLGYRDGRVEHVAKTLTVPSEEAIRIRLGDAP